MPSSCLHTSRAFRPRGGSFLGSSYLTPTRQSSCLHGRPAAELIFPCVSIESSKWACPACFHAGQPQQSSVFRTRGLASRRVRIICQKCVPDDPRPKSCAGTAVSLAAKAGEESRTGRKKRANAVTCRSCKDGHQLIIGDAGKPKRIVFGRHDASECLAARNHAPTDCTPHKASFPPESPLRD